MVTARNTKPPLRYSENLKFSALLLALLLAGCTQAPKYDLILRHAHIYDGSGGAPFTGDIAVNHDTIAKIGDLGKATGKAEIDVHGLAVAPGFINMLSWATDSLIADGRSMSDLRQGVTLEIFGEGDSGGPLN